MIQRNEDQKRLQGTRWPYMNSSVFPPRDLKLVWCPLTPTTLPMGSLLLLQTKGVDSKVACFTHISFLLLDKLLRSWRAIILIQVLRLCHWSRKRSQRKMTLGFPSSLTPTWAKIVVKHIIT